MLFYCVKYQHTGSGELVSTHLPPLPVKAVAQQQVKKLSKRSSRHEKLPLLPAGKKICLIIYQSATLNLTHFTRETQIAFSFSVMTLSEGHYIY